MTETLIGVDGLGSEVVDGSIGIGFAKAVHWLEWNVHTCCRHADVLSIILMWTVSCVANRRAKFGTKLALLRIFINVHMA